MLKGFKDFLMKGNVLDLAVAVVMGAAFTAIVKAFTDNIVQPLIASIGASPANSGLAWMIKAGNKATEVNLSAVITAIVNFILIAAVVYFLLVMPYERIKAHALKTQEEPAAATEAELLVEIRDLLARGSDGTK
ncbi:large conductance mechanosensitive channel protein MscL [Tsukamurella soli]|uniref:Large-conductance mechanosensitive channel n=1 Tax=Tsukamurella soli TaxID=644556 RepID=A0ABP8KDD1_9ACTN